jgi:hypothetical protein
LNATAHYERVGIKMSKYSYRIRQCEKELNIYEKPCVLRLPVTVIDPENNKIVDETILEIKLS